jgi:hypothetical protein
MFDISRLLADADPIVERKSRSYIGTAFFANFSRLPAK